MPKTVLLADDSVTIQRVVELTFAREDIRVVSVADGDQAIEALSHSVPDVVLADIDMPGRSGFEVAQFVRSQAATAEVPVLLLSGAFDRVDQEQARQAGADGILAKPFDPAVLVSRVMELLSGGRGTPSIVHVHPPSPSAVFRANRAVNVADDSAPNSAANTGIEPVPTSEPIVEVVEATDAAPDAAAPALVAEPADADYFDQIDQAFAALSKHPRPPAREDEDELPPLDDEWSPLDDEPLPSATTAAPVPLGVPLTDAFTALLEAERSGQPDPALRVVPAPAAAVARPPPWRPPSTSMRWPTRSPAACSRSSPTASCARRWPTSHRPRPSGWCVKRSSGSSATSNKISGCPVRSVP